jgi:hypothetical protein
VGNLHRWDDDGIAGSWETEAAGLTSVVTMRSNGTQMVISSNNLGYLFTLATNTLQALTAANFPFVSSNQPGAPGFPGASQFEFFDTYLVALDPGTRRFYWSFVNDAADWAALNFASKDSWPDNLVGLIMNQRLLWLFGSQRGEVWYDSGDPFQRVQGAQFGNRARRAVQLASGGQCDCLDWRG